MPDVPDPAPTDFDRLEAGLRPLDPAVEAFVARYDMELVVNDRGWPSRRMRWVSGGIERRIDVFLQDEEAGTLAVWAAAWIDRDDDRLGRSVWLRERVDPEALAGELDDVLEDARRAAEGWDRDELEPWADLEERSTWRAIAFLWIPFLVLAAAVIWVVDWILEGLL